MSPVPPLRQGPHIRYIPHHSVIHSAKHLLQLKNLSAAISAFIWSNPLSLQITKLVTSSRQSLCLLTPRPMIFPAQGRGQRGEDRKTNECILTRTPHILVILAKNLRFSQGQWLSDCSSGPKRARGQETEDERAGLRAGHPHPACLFLHVRLQIQVL